MVVWMITFQPHGGVELSRYLLPLSSLVFDRLYPSESVPVVAWYAVGFFQWVFAGVIVDLLRRAFRVYRQTHDDAA